MSKKYYAVVKGKKPGVFETWKECESNVKGFKGAIYKSFFSYEEAKQYLDSNNSSDEIRNDNELKKVIESDTLNGIVSIFVDGSYNKFLQQIGYGILIINSSNKNDWIKINNKLTEKEFNQYKKHLNISGEIIGTLEAIKYCVNHNLNKIKIYYDYEGIEKWANNSWDAKTPISLMYKQSLSELLKSFDMSLMFQKVKAHSDIEYNDIADSLAKQSVGIKS